MWQQMQKILGNGGEGSTPPNVPLRKALLDLSEIAVGKLVRFSNSCPFPQLKNAEAAVVAVRNYRFGDDVTRTYQLSVKGQKHFHLTIAEDEQGHYLGITRELSLPEQDSWFGHDALSFFTEASSARSIRCKADMAVDGEWAAGRYAKSVDWVEGTVSYGEARLPHSIHYSLLVNEAGDKALEIEHEDARDENRFFITVYRPVEDIAAIEKITITINQEPVLNAPQPKPKAEPIVHPTAANDDVPLFKPEPVMQAFEAAPVPPVPDTRPEPKLQAQPKARQDFRRMEEVEEPAIRIERTPSTLANAIPPEIDLPSFLLSREGHYLMVDQDVMPPEPEKIRVGLAAAHTLITHAMGKQVRVRDLLRDMLGLQSALTEEVIFELPLSDTDYRVLAMRYKLRPDHRVEIRSRLEEELRQKLLGLSKN